MSTIYLETSAVLTWLFGEARSKEVALRTNGAKTVVTSVLTVLETGRALIRVEKQKLLTAGDCQKLRGMLERTKKNWVLMELSDEVRYRAGQTFPVEPLRTLDAIHLATALVFMKAYPDLQMISFDQRIIDNIQPLGLG